MTQNNSHKTASILSIGDELIIGQSLDRHARWLAERLTSIGVRVFEHVTVDDDTPRLVAAMRRLASQSDLLLVTGGLGPTADDLTREALAEVLGDELVEDASAIEQLLGWFKGRGREMPERNRVQALRPESARCLDNPNGTAPGLAARVTADGRDCDVFCMPGPPREMYPMCESFVLPKIRTDPDRVVATRVLRTFGWGESNVAEALGDLMDRNRNPLIGTTASAGIVSVRMRYEGAAGKDEIQGLLDDDEAHVRAALPGIVLGREEELGESPLISEVSALLREHGGTLSTVESCTGGGIGEAVTALPGSSDVYAGGLVTYSNELKTKLAGVAEDTLRAHGAVSAQTAREMAAGGLGRLGTDHCLAVTGIAGPSGGTDDKPVGTVWIALASASRDAADIRRFVFRGGRAAVRQWTVSAALGMLRQRLAGIEGQLLGEVDRAES